LYKIKRKIWLVFLIFRTQRLNLKWIELRRMNSKALFRPLYDRSMLIIRSEQMAVFETSGDDFVLRLTKHMREDYGETVVRLPAEETAVKDLTDETLEKLVRVCIERAHSYGLTFESAISAYCAVMFETAPNFDQYNLCQLCLKDENIDPNKRLDEIITLFSEDNWKKVDDHYDVNAWEMDHEDVEEEVETPPEYSATLPNADPIAPSAPAAIPPDFAETSLDLENAGQPRVPDNIDDIDFDATIVDFEGAQSPGKTTDDDDIDFDATIVNIDPTDE
jgi:hypothetical protein